MSEGKALKFRGDGKSPQGKVGPRGAYLADPALVDVVNMAVTLGRPLLVKGPPGCGKTRLAGAIAHELGLPLLEWYVKSTSQAVDGLYTIDVLRRLQDVQLGERFPLTHYIKFGALGNALRAPSRCVLLIDEIDKASMDFPNDLLRELDEKRFTIEELDEDRLTKRERAAGFRKTYEAKTMPIVVITSNDEKELPDAFLRRCLFYYIEFPEPKQLVAIVKENSRGLKLAASLVRRAAERLRDIRAVGGFRKEPATSELIDWVQVLHHWGIDLDEIGKDVPLDGLPHWDILFKHRQDQQRLARHARGSDRGA